MEQLGYLSVIKPVQRLAVPLAGNHKNTTLQIIKFDNK